MFPAIADSGIHLRETEYGGWQTLSRSKSSQPGITSYSSVKHSIYLGVWQTKEAQQTYAHSNTQVSVFRVALAMSSTDMT